MIRRYLDESRNVLRSVVAATRRQLRAMAAYVRGVARKSISKTKKPPSPPGSPPRSPTGRLHSSIAFNVDPQRLVATIGPARSVFAEMGHTHEFGGMEPPKRGRAKGTLYEQLRVGGIGVIRITGRRRLRIHFAKLTTESQVQRSKGLLASANLPLSVTGLPRNVSRRYPRRPFMGPALRIAAKRLPAHWRNAVKA